MSHQQLRDDLESLRIQISALDDHPEAQSRMSALLVEFEAHLASAEGDAATRPPEEANTSSLKQRLDDSVGRFEAEHPILTGVLNDIMNTLSGMGI